MLTGERYTRRENEPHNVAITLDQAQHAGGDNGSGVLDRLDSTRHSDSPSAQRSAIEP